MKSGDLNKHKTLTSWVEDVDVALVDARLVQPSLSGPSLLLCTAEYRGIFALMVHTPSCWERLPMSRGEGTSLVEGLAWSFRAMQYWLVQYIIFTTHSACGPI